MVVRNRLARAQFSAERYDDALATIDGAGSVESADAFAAIFSELRGDILLVQGDESGARDAYLAAREQSQQGRSGILELKLSDLGVGRRLDAVDRQQAGSGWRFSVLVAALGVSGCSTTDTFEQPVPVPDVDNAVEFKTVWSTSVGDGHDGDFCTWRHLTPAIQFTQLRLMVSWSLWMQRPENYAGSEI